MVPISSATKIRLVLLMGVSPDRWTTVRVPTDDGRGASWHDRVSRGAHPSAITRATGPMRGRAGAGWHAVAPVAAPSPRRFSDPQEPP